MKRIQIIFTLLAAVTVISVISGGESKTYYSEYDSRFLCSLKSDFEFFDFSEEINPAESEKELSSFSANTGYNTNSRTEISKKCFESDLQKHTSKQLLSFKETVFKKTIREHSSAPRSPPLFS